MTENEIGYRVASMVLRPPRVAILFRADEHWRDWAKLAVSVASRRWGGESYIFVPYTDSGEVNPKLLQAAVEYDPDYVAIVVNDIETWLRVAPDQVSDIDSGLTPEQTAELHAQPLDDKAATLAAKALAAACSPLAHGPLGSRPPVILKLSPKSIETNQLLTAPRPGAGSPSAALSVHPDWPGDAALFASAITGVAPVENEPRAAPADDTLLAWLVDPSPANAPDELLWFPTMSLSSRASDQLTWFQAASPDLGHFDPVFTPYAAAIVIGSTADDYALAVIYSRAFGYALWLTPDLIENHLADNWSLQHRLNAHLERFQFVDSIPVVTLSLEESELQSSFAKFTIAPSTITIDGHDMDLGGHPQFTFDFPPMNQPLRVLALPDHISTSVTLPVEVAPDGGVTLQAPVVAPIPAAPLPLTKFDQPAWLIDVSIEPPTMPKGRGLSSLHLVDHRTSSSIYLIRSSRDGVTYSAANQGFVSGGTVLAGRLAKPLLRQLGMYSWVQAMAEQEGLGASRSTPGERAEMLARRIGGRERLMEIVAGPFRPVLQSFAPTTRSTRSSSRFPSGRGVVVDGTTPYLTFEGMLAETSTMGWQAVRGLVDELASSGLMRQGFVLDCQECRSPAFVSIDDLGQRYECSRCAATNSFGLARWKSPVAEPSFFYDLHSSFRSLFSENGDVPLLTATHLKASSRFYADTSEVEFVSVGSTSPDFEIDLIALVDQELIVVEAKSTSSLGSGRERNAMITKRFQAARLLRADVVLFSTTSSEWAPDLVSTAAQIRDSDYPDIQLRWIAGLSHGGSHDAG